MSSFMFGQKEIVSKDFQAHDIFMIDANRVLISGTISDRVSCNNG